MKLEQLYHPKVLNTAKFFLLLVTFVFIFYKLFYAYHLEQLIENYHFEINDSKLTALIFAVVLMFCNWLLEAGKWRLLINKNEKISFMHSVKAVVSGIALSIITPNQIGDFAGRIIHLKKFDKIKGSLVTVIGHTAQVIMTLAFGLFAFIFILHAQHKISDQVSLVTTLVSILSIVIAIYAFLNIHLISRISFSKKIKPYLEVFSFYTKNELLKVLIFSFLRYSVFIIQYVLLLHFFGVEISLITTVCCIIATLCAQSFVPSFLLIEIGMRGASALFFFTIFTNNSAGVLLSAYSLWIINLMLPAFYGLIVIVNHKFKK